MSLCRDFQATCPHCGNSYLRWEHTRRGWRLFDMADQLHDCAAGRRARRAYFLAQHPAAKHLARIRREGRARIAREA